MQVICTIIKARQAEAKLRPKQVKTCPKTALRQEARHEILQEKSLIMFKIILVKNFIKCNISAHSRSTTPIQKEF
jgi:hypothetical protein